MSTYDLDTLSALVLRPDEECRLAARERWDALAQPRHSLGSLEELGSWLAAVQGLCPPRPLSRVRTLVFAGDHGVAALGVSAHAPGSTVRRMHALLDGTAPASLLARQFDASLQVLDFSVAGPGDTADAADDPADPAAQAYAALPAAVTKHRIRQGSGRIDIEDATTRQEAEAAFLAGMALADAEADSGTDLVVLGDVGTGSTTVAAVLVAALCGTDASVTTGRGSGIDDRVWMVKCAAVRDALRRARPRLGDPIGLLAAVGGADFAAMTGFLLQAAVRRLPVLLDGVVSAACALLAQRVAFRAPEWWQAGQTTGEPAQAKAYERMNVVALQDQSVGAGEGTGALVALPLLRAAALLLAELPLAHIPSATPDAGTGAAGDGATGTGSTDAGPTDAAPTDAGAV